MQEIEFVSSEIASFYGKSFHEGDFNVLMKDGNDVDFFKCVKSLQKEIANGSVQNINDMNKYIFDTLPKDHVSGIEKSKFRIDMIRKYNEHKSSYQENLPIIEKHRSVMEKLQKDSGLGYSKELNELYSLFGVDKENKCKCLLVPMDKNPSTTGIASEFGTIHYFNTNKKADERYIDNSTVLESKVSNPLHETTHFLFANSPVRDSFRESKGEGIQRLTNNMSSFMDMNPDYKENRGSSLSNSKLAIDEALAASAGAMVGMKFGKNVETTGWYDGFKGADMLASHTYPVMKEYMEKGKTIDDDFFAKISDNLEKSEKFVEFKRQEQKNALLNSVTAKEKD